MEQNGPEINPLLHGQLTFDKGGNGVKTIYSISGVGKIGHLHAKKMKQDHLLTPCTRINSKRVTDLNVRLKTIKLLEKYIGSKISNISSSDIFPDISPQSKEKNKQLGLH